MRRESGWIVAAGAAVLLAGCGSEESKMERGVAVDREVNVPQSEKELGMTEAERRAAEEAEDKEREAKLFEENQR